jgi:YD repeat-containing protein
MLIHVGPAGQVTYDETIAGNPGDRKFLGFGANYPNGGSPYFPSPPTAGGSCVQDGEGCVHCSGGFSINLYSIQGSVEGTVRKGGEPVAGATVVAEAADRASDVSCGSGLASATTDASGRYTFTSPTAGGNNWGLGLLGDGSAKGERKYFLRACSQAGESASHAVLITSNDLKPAHFDIEEPIRGPCPDPSVGKPVNALNGAVWFDQTDVTLPTATGPIAFTRSYASSLANEGVASSLGAGWTHSYGQALELLPSGALKIRRANGEVAYFRDPEADLTYAASFPPWETSWVVREGVGGGTTYTRHFREGGQETYDSAGTLVGLVTAAGNATALAHDASGRLSAIGSGARSLTLAYDSSSRLETLVGPDGVIAWYAYGAGNRLARVTYADGTGYAFTYDSGGRVLNVADLAGAVVETHAYDAQGRGITSEISDGKERLSLAFLPGKTEVTNALGQVTTYEWSYVAGVRRITRITGPCESCGGSGSEVREWTYDDEGRIVAHTSGAHTSSYGYHPSGHLAWERNALDQTTSYTYDAQGRLLTATRPDGGVTTYTHAPAGPLTVTEKVTATQSRVTTFTYDGQGRPTSVTDPTGKTTVMAYDDTSGDLVSVTDPLNHSTGFGYDSLGRRTTVTDALNHTTTTTYDARGRVTRITQADGTHTDFGYDAAGRRTSVTDPMDRTTSYAYDAYGRLRHVVDPNRGTTSYTWDEMSRLVALTDALGRSTAFEYDGQGRVLKTTYPGGAFETYTYDSAGRVA